MAGISTLLDRFSAPKPGASKPEVPGSSNTPEAYKSIPSNWYSAKPYGFKFQPKGNGKPVIFFLPISPSNLTITTSFATNVIPTLYGTVEEHSDIRYYDIRIQGTTGIAPKYTKEYSGGQATAAAKETSSPGRASFPIASGVAAGGFFSKTLGLLNQIKSKATDLIDGAPKPETGVFTQQSGYVAFHNLYKFLHKYKKDASGADGKTGKRSKHPLTFFNYKDNNQYDVAVRSFTLVRSAENPMLYNYVIELRGYNLHTVGDAVSEDITERLKDLGLDGIDSSSLLGDIKGVANNAKAVIGSAVAGISVLGR
jgi:hypothetical protein